MVNKIKNKSTKYKNIGIPIRFYSSALGPYVLMSLDICCAPIISWQSIYVYTKHTSP